MGMNTSGKVQVHTRDGIRRVEDMGDDNTSVVVEGIPTEILSEIFKLTCASDNPSHSPQMTLSHVNRCWRSIICDMPELWTTIEIRQCDANVLQEVLHRSKGRLLNIDINLSNATSIRATIGTLKILKAEMGRCRSITMVASETTYKLVCGIFGDALSAPHLSSLELTSRHRIEGQECLFPYVTFNPRVLRHVLLDGVSIPLADFSGIETMAIKNLSAHWLPLSLGQNNVLHNITVFNTILTWRTNLVTPRLTDMTLDWQDISTVLVANWNAPALENLTISKASGAVWSSLMFYLTRNPQPAAFMGLKGLKLVNCDAVAMEDHLEVTPFMEAIRSLTSLEFVHTTPGLVLAYLRQCPQACPHLVNIQVDGDTILRPGVGSP
ncbi:hypothetical protein Hypma_004376 [Hypsizygus marmoreus]|uniref:Uncharacterized protein n=1 Tax=Hypsizygus marmoreus TaxID=39966 RepID=A0A369K3R9_HYPMA|nr:hypothetical protein Hypma_004376 [Hypsizygus marmoreus]